MNFKQTLSLRFDQHQIEILDQTRLPFEEVWFRLDTTEDAVMAIKSLKVRGAPLIGVTAAIFLAQNFCKRPDVTSWLEHADAVYSARPTAVNLMAAVTRLKNVVMVGASAEEVWGEALKIFEEDVEACEQMAKHGADLLGSDWTILTHCNTGSLATAGRGTALSVIHEAFMQGKIRNVYVDETRPLLQGARLTSYELKKREVPHTLICDNMAAILMKQNRIDAVIVGADRIARNGDFANKVGTYNLAVLCRFHQIPFYVVAPLTTMDLDCVNGEFIPIEEREASEVRGFRDYEWAPTQINIYNPAFDVTPAELVTAWIFERGVYRAEDLKSAELEQLNVKLDLEVF